MTSRQNVMDALRRYKARYAEQYGIETLGLFGSYARDEQRDTSDIDIFYTVTKPSLHLVCTIHDDLKALLHHDVDLVRLRPNMNKALLSNIRHDGILA